MGKAGQRVSARYHDPMPGSTSLRLIITPQQRGVTERLWQLYRHDLSEFRGSMPDSEGLYNPGRLPTFFEGPDRCGYLIYNDQAPAGFALIRGLTEEQKVVGEFFVVRAVRRQRVGYEAAMALLRLHPGSWAIPFQEENHAAAHFWRRVAADATGAPCHEERRPGTEKREITPDTWLLLGSCLLIRGLGQTGHAGESALDAVRHSQRPGLPIQSRPVQAVHRWLPVEVGRTWHAPVVCIERRVMSVPGRENCGRQRSRTGTGNGVRPGMCRLTFLPETTL
jgi:predicted acetyltransferase